jgi:hypothetical protein
LFLVLFKVVKRWRGRGGCEGKLIVVLFVEVFVAVKAGSGS